MKQSLLILMFLPVLGMAQPHEGKVMYQETLDMDIEARAQRIRERMDGVEGADAIIARMKEMQKSQKVLTFTPTQSYYKAYEDPTEPKELDGSSGATRRGMMRPKLEVYQNLAEGRAVSQQDFMGKLFLVKMDMKDQKWKLTPESDTIAGYLCQKATSMKDTLQVEAWFCPQIPVSAGPVGFGQLPGLILKLNVEKRYQVQATKVTFEPVDEASFHEPDKGKEVTEEEFTELVKEKMKEMREMYGGERGGMRMMMH
ncbi:MAG: GLPGLI family protein [Flavobacteriales bacterium]|nr:GLPGLI family protein [Flavobacteriales bacterium]MCB9446721.1 GLPGLI family protein [Flavobacteriales bacterium]